jgi:hypothetical protein
MLINSINLMLKVGNKMIRKNYVTGYVMAALKAQERVLQVNRLPSKLSNLVLW